MPIKLPKLSTTKKRISSYLDRRPHRSFRVSRKRDYRRDLILPGYWSFTAYVFKVLWGNRKTFLLLGLTYALLTVGLVGIASQDSYTSLTDLLASSSNNVLDGNWGEVGKAGLLFVSTVSGSISPSLTESQQIYAAIISLMAWLTTVWLLRNILAGHKVKLRDGLYGAGSPILATTLVALVLLVQMIPLALALMGYAAASSTGLLAAGGVESMLFWLVAGLLTILTLYFITSTAFALVVVTLPGMYPMAAIKTAGDLVIGRRLRILMRFLWLALVVALSWVIIMIPVILLDMWIKGLWSDISWVPIIPITLLILGSVTIIWVSSYIYLLYRKVVDNVSTT